MQTEASGQGVVGRHRRVPPPLDDGGAHNWATGAAASWGYCWTGGYCWTKPPGAWLGDPWLGEMAGPVDGSSRSARYADRRANPYVSTWATNPGSECWTLSTSSATSAGRRTSSRTERVFHIGLRPFKSVGVRGGNRAGRGVTWHRYFRRETRGKRYDAGPRLTRDRGGWPRPATGLPAKTCNSLFSNDLRIMRPCAAPPVSDGGAPLVSRSWSPLFGHRFDGFQVPFRHGVMGCSAARRRGPSGA